MEERRGPHSRIRDRRGVTVGRHDLGPELEPKGAKTRVYLREGLGSVVVRIALAEHVEVHPVKHQDLLHRVSLPGLGQPPRCPGTTRSTPALRSAFRSTRAVIASPSRNGST